MPKKPLIIGIIFILGIVYMPNSISLAETADDIRAKINNANRNREQLEKEIIKYQEQLRTINEQAVSLQNTIKSLDVSAGKITTEVKLTENNIDRTTYGIQDTDHEIRNKENQIDRDKRAIRDSLRQIDGFGTQNIWEMILSQKDLSYFWTEMENIIRVQDRIGNQVVTVKKIKSDLEQARADLEDKKKELEKYTAELNERKLVLQSAKKEKNTLLSATKNTEANYQKILNDKLALKEALDKEINEFESQFRLVIDPKSFPKAGKGILAWPLENIYITQNFGKTSDSGRLYVSGTHNGTDFRAAIGTKIMSAGNGTIEGVGDTDIVCPGASFGKWVFIRYDNGLASTYGHLSLITAKIGQRVTTGEIVGYSGNTGYSTGPHLHMSVYAGQGVKISSLKSTVCKGTYTIPMADIKAYLDPLIYL